MANRRTATVLKLLNGSAAHNKAVVRDDASVKPAGLPVAFDFLGLDADERAMFEHLVQCGSLPTVHAESDSFLFATAAKLCVALLRAQQKVREFGTVMIDPSNGKPTIQPYFTAMCELQRQVLRTFNEIGLSPSARLRFAPRPSQGNGTTWDID